MILWLLSGRAGSQACSSYQLNYNGSQYCVNSCPIGTYAPTGQASLICTTCFGTCMVCTSQNTCSQCIPRQYVSSKNLCDMDCPNVVLNGVCANTCPNNYYQYNDQVLNNVYCRLCASNCATCSGTSTTCLTCPANFTLSSTSICVALCPAGQDCSCNSPEFVLQDSGQCVNQCPTGYYISQENICSVCALSVSNCLTCSVQANTNTVTCSLCMAPLYVLNNTCVNECPTGYYVDYANKACLAPSVGCPAGEYLYDPKQFICMACTQGCSSCTIGTTICTACSQGYYADSNTSKTFNCKPCSVLNCDACTSNGTCTSCYTQYFQVASSNTCTACLTACNTCNSTATCQTCTANATLNTNASACACNSGFYMVTNRATGVPTTNTCSQCDKTCLTCTGVDVNCTSCPVGRYIAPDNTCPMCGPRCSACNNANTCTACVANAGLTSAGQCACNAGFLASGNTSCTACPAPCAVCKSATVCSVCNVGYFFANNGNCNSCGQHCVSCKTSTSCLKCEPNYDIISGTCSKVWRVAAISIGIGLAVVILLVLGIYFFKKCIEKNTGEDEDELNEELQVQSPQGPF